MLPYPLNPVNSLNSISYPTTIVATDRIHVTSKINKQNKLKKNKSSFMFFAAEVRGAYKQNGIKINPNKMMGIIAHLWRNLDPTQKAKYDAAAQRDRERYQLAKDELLRTDPSKLPKNRTKSNHVKKDLSGYDIFVQEMYSQLKAENPGLYSADIIQIVGRWWQNLDESQKSIYKMKSAADKKEKQAQRKALELKRPSKESCTSLTESENGLSPTSRKQIKRDTLCQSDATFTMSSSRSFIDPSEVMMNHTSFFTFEQDTNQTYSCCVQPSITSRGADVAELDCKTSNMEDKSFSIQNMDETPASAEPLSSGLIMSPITCSEQSHFDFSLDEVLGHPFPSKETTSVNSLDMDESGLNRNEFDGILNLELCRHPSLW